MLTASTEETRARKLLAYATVGYAFFVVYGSLIPFAFEPRSFEQVLAILSASSRISPLVSLTDRATNIFLSVPLAFFALGAMADIDRPLSNTAAVIMIWIGCVALAITVEILQALTPERVASTADIFAQAIGAFIGILLWACIGKSFLRIVQWLTQSEVDFQGGKIASVGIVWIIAVPYLIFLLALNGWLTSGWTSFAAARHTARETSYLPFFYQYSANIFLAAASCAKYVTLYAPIGIFYWIYSSPHSYGGENRRCWAAALIAASVSSVIETGKFLLPSKHPDITNIFIAACASAAAYWLFPRLLFSGHLPYKPKPRTVEIKKTPHPLPQDGWLRVIGFKLLAIASFGATALGVAFFPSGPLWLGFAIAVYTLALFRYPAIWLFVIPALLPSFDLAPWTGWFFLNEWDLFVFSTIGVGLWLSAPSAGNARLSPLIRLLLCAFAGSTLLSLLIGLLPLQSLDFNAFSNYYSRYNALRAAKGMFEVLALLPFLAYSDRRGDNILHYFSAGMVAGLATATVASIWERALFPGLFDFTSNYRISALFSSMHTGDSSIEAYFVAALPFTMGWAFYRKSPLSKVLAAILFGLGSYALFATFSRGGYGAYVLIVFVLIAGALLTSKTRLLESQRTFIAIIAICASLGGLTAVMALESSFARARFSTAETDLGVRLRHWRGVVTMMDQDWQTSLFGMGLGRYPDVYFHRNWSVRMPSTITYLTEGNNTFLRLGAGAPAYLEQIAPVAPNEEYRFALDLRPTASRAALNVMICQRTFFRSFNCKDSGISSTTDERAWTHHEAVVNSGILGDGPWFARRIVKFVLENTSNEAAVDIDNVKLMDRGGDNLLANGDFSSGSTYWFYSSFDHLNWHIKNIFVQLFFEQGWIGLALFGLLALSSIASLWSMANRGEIIFLVPLASLIALLSVGLFGSPLDTPRLAFLFYFVMLAADLCAMKSLSIVENAVHTQTARISESSPAPSKKVEQRAKVPALDSHQPGQIHSDYSLNKAVYNEVAQPPLTSSQNVPIFGSLLIKILVGIAVFVSCAWVLMHSSAAPYNVRNLLHPVHPFLSLVALSAFLYWTFGFPVVTIYWLTGAKLRAFFYPLLLACHSAAAFFLLSYSVSFDRIHKIVGAPILGWHWYWEPAGRFVALFTAISMSLTCGTLVATRLSYHRKILTAFIVWVITAAALSPFLYWIVIDKAATDNLIELLAGHGTAKAAMLLSLYLATIVFEGALLAGQTQQRLRGLKLATLIALVLSVPIACLAIYYGTEQHVEKYGKTFSALQFLLSRDRENYAQAFELMARYFVFHAAIVSLVFMIQYPFFSGLFGSANRSGREKDRSTNSGLTRMDEQ